MQFNEILDRNFAGDVNSISTTPALSEIFNFLDHNRELTRVMIGPHGDLAFVNRLKILVKERLRHFFLKEEALRNFEYYYSFTVSGCIGVIETWLNSDSPRRPEEMAALCGVMINSGLGSLTEA